MARQLLTFVNMRLTTLTMFATTLVALSLPASADTTGLADWCVNLNGDINTACNGAGGGGSSPGGGTISLSGFDASLELSTNSLGKIVVTVGTGAQLAAVYMDYDLDFLAEGSFQDVGSTVGSLSASQSYELADPNVSNIFSDFSSDPGPLLNTNGVGTFSGPPSVCCDVSWALEEALFVNPALYSGATVTFYVNTTQIAADSTSGFFLQQTNGDVGDSIFLSDTVSFTPLTITTTPEPMSIILFGTLIVGALFLRKRSRANAA